MNMFIAFVWMLAFKLFMTLVDGVSTSLAVTPPFKLIETVDDLANEMVSDTGRHAIVNLDPDVERWLRTAGDESIRYILANEKAHTYSIHFGDIVTQLKQKIHQIISGTHVGLLKEQFHSAFRKINTMFIQRDTLHFSTTANYPILRSSIYRRHLDPKISEAYNFV